MRERFSQGPILSRMMMVVAVAAIAGTAQAETTPAAGTVAKPNFAGSYLAGRSARDVFTLAASQGMQVRHLRPSVPTLEDVFIDAIEGGTRAHS